MTDRILEGFLTRQAVEAAELSAASDLVEVLPLDGPPPRHYAVRYRCKGLVKAGGEIQEAQHFEIGVWFPPDYLRRADPFQILTWFGPPNVFHPNISDRAPFICVGRLAPGTSLADIVYQVFDIITYQKVTPREDDALNHEACAWVRNNRHRLPVDRRPLKRRRLELKVQPR
jgi:hypothetical protein